MTGLTTQLLLPMDDQFSLGVELMIRGLDGKDGEPGR
jgi:hypothetical protein